MPTVSAMMRLPCFKSDDLASNCTHIPKESTRGCSHLSARPSSLRTCESVVVQVVAKRFRFRRHVTTSARRAILKRGKAWIPSQRGRHAQGNVDHHTRGTPLCEMRPHFLIYLVIENVQNTIVHSGRILRFAKGILTEP